MPIVLNCPVKVWDFLCTLVRITPGAKFTFVSSINNCLVYYLKRGQTHEVSDKLACLILKAESCFMYHG